jgi:penicillin-binding protein 1C
VWCRKWPGRALVALGAGLAGIATALVGVVWLLTAGSPLTPAELAPEDIVTLRVLDRQGGLLRDALTFEPGRARWTPLGEHAPSLVPLLVATEDRRFFGHPGVDPVAVAGAAWANFRAGRIVRGGSTLTQQLVRLVRPATARRTIAAKLREMADAVALERAISKPQILEQYLNRVPFSHNTRGFAAAARVYFGVDVAQLTVAQAATLVALVNGPTLYDPWRHPDRLAARRNAVLDACGTLTDRERAAARDAPLGVLRAPGIAARAQARAPHFVDALMPMLAQDPALAPARVVTTTIDPGLQLVAETSLRKRIGALAETGAGATTGAVVVLDHRSGEILALAGSPDYGDAANAGQVNGALTARQPGSALKPFTYALALAAGETAASIVRDEPVAFAADEGVFRPGNYDDRFHGPVTLRRALANSYNVAAVQVLNRVGPARLLALLREAGLTMLDGDAGHYGLGLTLGNGEVTPLALAQAYAMLARGGVPVRPRWILTAADAAGARMPLPAQTADATARLLPAPVCALVADILADDDARAETFGRGSLLRFPFSVAAKTGTSQGFRDNWVAGFTGAVTVVVWVGRHDGAPMRGVSGLSGAGPIFHDVIEVAAARYGEGLPPMPGGPAGLERRPVTVLGQGLTEWFVTTPGPARP